MQYQDAYWLPQNPVDEARLIKVLGEMVLYFFATEEVKNEEDEKREMTEKTDPNVESAIYQGQKTAH